MLLCHERIFMTPNYYYSLNDFLRNQHGEKILKLSIDAGFTCPNRDGTLSTKGCLFCSERGSGDFTFYQEGNITRQLEDAKKLLENKWGKNRKYIVYFQAFTNTYDSLEVLKKKYEEALAFDGVVGLAIATRPDCLSDDILAYLSKLSKQTHVWVELGLQTIHEETSKLINRGYTLDCFENAVKKLHKYGIETVVHLILGLPGESVENMLASAKYISSLPLQGVKLHMLHILDNAPLGKYYKCHPFPLMTEETYISLIGEILSLLPPEFVIHRLTGDGAREHLIGPTWTLHKKHVLNGIMRHLKENNLYQGKSYNKNVEFS